MVKNYKKIVEKIFFIVYNIYTSSFKFTIGVGYENQERLRRKGSRR